MYKHTITRTRPSKDVRWHWTLPEFDKVYQGFPCIKLVQEFDNDGLTVKVHRFTTKLEDIQEFEQRLNDVSSDQYKYITKYYLDNNVITTYETIET